MYRYARAALSHHYMDRYVCLLYFRDAPHPFHAGIGMRGFPREICYPDYPNGVSIQRLRLEEWDGKRCFGHRPRRRFSMFIERFLSGRAFEAALTVFNERGISANKLCTLLECGNNQVRRWVVIGAPRYIALALTAIFEDRPPWRRVNKAEKTCRNKEIIAAHDGGLSFREIGLRFGITQERARQIYLDPKLVIGDRGRWIDVCERLPERDCDVWVWWGGSEVFLAEFGINESTGWRGFYADGVGALPKVSHWMQLIEPAPPVKAEQTSQPTRQRSPS
jgi:hypothetical protein